MSDDITVTTKTLEFLQVAASYALPKELERHSIRGGRDWVVAVMRDTLDSLVMQLKGYIASETLKVVTIKHPADWKEAVKERWAPTWLLKRYPVRYQEHVIDLKAVYPEMPLPKSCGPFVRIQTYSGRIPEVCK